MSDFILKIKEGKLILEALEIPKVRLPELKCPESFWAIPKQKKKNEIKKKN